MDIIGWFRATQALTASYVKLSPGFKIYGLKLKGDIEVSFDGTNSHIKLVAADGMQTFENVGRSDLYVKGSGNAEIIAWDGN